MPRVVTLNRAAAALLVLLAVLAFTPVAVVDGLWLGPQIVGASVGEDSFYVVVGLITFLSGAIPVAMLATVPGAWRGERRPLAWGSLFAVLATALAAGPLREISLASWIVAGRWIALAVGLLTAAVLMVAAIRVAPVGHWRAAPRLAVALLAIAFVAGAIGGRSADGIPLSPSRWLIADFRGGERLTGAALKAAAPAQDPFLAPGPTSNIHNDAFMSDAYFGPRVVDPETATVRSFRALGDCASIMFDRRGRLVAVCVGPTRVVAYLIDPDTLEPLAERFIADRVISGDFDTTYAGGGYAFLDRAGRLVIPGTDGVIERFRITDREGHAAIEALDAFDVSHTLAPDEPISSALPDWSGRLWYVGSEGTVGTLNPSTREARSIRFEDADIENSFALAPDGGAYVVTSRELVSLRIGSGGLPQVIWSQAYDRGRRRKPGQSSRASGTTPTVLLGGRFVAIADNAEPRMHVQVYDARPGVRGSWLVCETEVFEPDRSATENSLIAVGGAIFVENNHGYRLFDSLGGHVPESGAARIDFDPRARSCEIAWENDDVYIPSVVSKVSAPDGTMLTYTKEPYPTGVEAWWFTALDANTGEVLWRRLAGTGVLANNHYAAVYVGPGGNLYVGTVGGVIALVG